ncbi:MAG: class II fructose-1,6-bisphosphate aldolase [Thermoanaerobacteraceae bacterium]|nr:class II fructose-1,6-bisphosphate aldolase [Thermoanaerobacteraceae bacterium]
MPLVTMTELLEKAEHGKYAVGAFNCNNMEIIQAIVAAAEEENAPVIIQASQGAIKYAGLDYITAMVKTAAENTDIPIALHIDHGTSFEQVMRCIRRGFTSVMIDGSKLPLEENIALTNKVVEVARAVGVSVEAELGKIGGTEDDISVSEWEASLTDPEEAKVFVEATGVDALAIAIGTAHGQYKGEPKLDFDRLKRVRELVDIPIVLHGSSGVPADSIRKAIELGVRKINIDTNLREAFVNRAREVMAEKPDEIDPRKILGPARDAMKEVIKEKIRLFGSSQKA